MIEVENLTKRYGDFTAVKEINFRIEKGEVIGFLGPNAAGKSTTMRIITCFMPATEGTVRVDGYDVFDDSMEVRKRIGYMPENVPLYTEMSVKSYLHFMAKIKGVPRSQRNNRVDEVINACGLDNFRNRATGKLSKGYRQRVGLAQALVHNPQVLILDEPTIGLDPRQIIEIRNLIKSFGGDHTVLLSTHILPEASMICNRIIVINEGKIAGTVGLMDGKVINIQHEGAERVDLEKLGNIHLQVKGNTEEIIDQLKAIENIDDVQLTHYEDKVGFYNITHEMGSDIRPQLAKIIIQNGSELMELRPMEMTLEDAFLELTREEVVGV
ncbi:ATP-binding cassette domain-containing protein [Candidatus Poribacteria bacterium]|nr:ATP-binding cassette domain-containing protein [Candidatus Poribacteria bacterium]